MTVKKSESRENTKRLLLNAGYEIFSKYGYDGATTKMVATHSGVNESLINRYFSGKAGLLEAIIIDFYQNLRKKVKKYPHGKTLQEEIRNYLEAAISDFNQNPKFLKIIFPRMIIDDDLRKRVISTLEIPNPRLFGCLETYQKKKIIHHAHNLKESVDMINFFVIGFIHERTFLRITKLSLKKYLDNASRMACLTLTSPKN